MNFIEYIISNGYERVVPESEKNKGRYDISYNLKNGWYGVTVYHPYEVFVNGDKKIELSLEQLVEGKKVIQISRNGDIIYKNEYGIMPTIEQYKALL